jgi:hypothetical protein
VSVAFYLAETTLMIENTRGIVGHEAAYKILDIQFISDNLTYDQNSGFMERRE